MQAQAALYRRVFIIAPTDADTILAAADLAQRHRLQLWDSVIWKASAQAGALVLLSEDLQDGLTLNGMRVLDPFAAANRRELERLLAG